MSLASVTFCGPVNFIHWDISFNKDGVNCFDDLGQHLAIDCGLDHWKTTLCILNNVLKHSFITQKYKRYNDYGAHCWKYHPMYMQICITGPTLEKID
jgi:hypothetical protein